MKIAQITDFHLRHHLHGSSSIAERCCRDIPDLLPRALEQIAGHDIELLAVTGDLVDVPDSLVEQDAGKTLDASSESYRQTMADYRLIKKILDNTGIPYIVLPGNHDLEAAFWEVFDSKADEISAGGYRVIRFCDREHDQHIPHRIGEQYTRFINALNDTASQPQIHLQHYLIHPHLNESYPHSYINSFQLCEQILHSRRVILCLQGHYHRGVSATTIENTTFATCPAFCVKPFPWREYEIIDNHVTESQYALDQ